jgi:hypothetical protein
LRMLEHLSDTSAAVTRTRSPVAIWGRTCRSRLWVSSFPVGSFGFLPLSQQESTRSGYLRRNDHTKKEGLWFPKSPLFLKYLGWCRRGESNPHGARLHWILSPARLPVSPLRHRHRCRYPATTPSDASRPGLARSLPRVPAPLQGFSLRCTVRSKAPARHADLSSSLAACLGTAGRPYRRLLMQVDG